MSRSAADRQTRLTVLVALAANLVIAAAKTVGGLISGSPALLSEAAHSVADSLNEIFLLAALRRSRLPADARHPFGYGKERYFWALLAAVGIFVMGGCFSFYQGLHALRRDDDESPTGYTAGLIVLGVALVAESTSLARALHQARGKTGAAIDPALRTVIAEDSTAVLGVSLAIAGMSLHLATGSVVWESGASLGIGLLPGLRRLPARPERPGPADRGVRRSGAAPRTRGLPDAPERDRQRRRTPHHAPGHALRPGGGPDRPGSRYRQRAGGGGLDAHPAGDVRAVAAGRPGIPGHHERPAAHRSVSAARVARPRGSAEGGCWTAAAAPAPHTREKAVDHDRKRSPQSPLRGAPDGPGGPVLGHADDPGPPGRAAVLRRGPGLVVPPGAPRRRVLRGAPQRHSGGRDLRRVDRVPGRGGLDAVLRGGGRGRGRRPGPGAQRNGGGGAADARQGAWRTGLGPRGRLVRPLGAHRARHLAAAILDDHAHAWLRLRTRNAFDAAIFYGEVLDWASGRPGCCDVSYEGDEVIVRCEGRPLARISSGAVEAAVDPLVRPHWQVQFPVEDVPATVAEAERQGGSLIEERSVLGGGEATLRDPDGALFTVTDVRSPVGAEG